MISLQKVHTGQTSQPFQVKDQITIDPVSRATKLRVICKGDQHARDKNSASIKGPGKLFEDHMERFSKEDDSIHNVLVENGDTWDLIASGKREAPPFGKGGSLPNPKLEYGVLEKIISDNRKIIKTYRNFLRASRHNEIVFNEGNHDRPLFHIDNTESRLLLAQSILPEASIEELERRFHYGQSCVIPAVGIYAKHCHDLDPFNYSRKGENTKGDWVVITSNSIVNTLISELQANNLEPFVLEKALTSVERTLRIRPPIAFPIYLQYEAKRLFEENGYSDITSVNKAKEIMMSYSNEFRNHLLDLSLFKTLRKNGFLPDWLIQFAFGESMQQIGARLISIVESWFSDNNEVQIEEAQKIHKKCNREGMLITHFVGSHTHAPNRDERLIYGESIISITLPAWTPFKEVINGHPLGSVHPSGLFVSEVDLTIPAKRRKASYERTIVETWNKRV